MKPLTQIVMTLILVVLLLLLNHIYRVGIEDGKDAAYEWHRTHPNYDLNHDSRVDIQDISILSKHIEP